MDIITETESQTLTPKTYITKHLDRVVRKPASANPGLKVTCSVVYHSVYYCVVQDYLNIKLKEKTDRKITKLKSNSWVNLS